MTDAAESDDGVDVMATVYRVTAVPAEAREHRDANMWALWVEHRGNGRWLVTNGTQVLSRGGWRAESEIGAEDWDQWIADRRLSLGQALRVAKDIAPRIFVGDRDAAGFAEWVKQLDKAGEP